MSSDVIIMRYLSLLEDKAVIATTKVICNCAANSTHHGLSHLASATGFTRRLFWLLIGLLATAGFIFNLYSLFATYILLPIVTNVEHDKDYFMFPDITLCNTNPIRFPPKNTTIYTQFMKHIEMYKKDPSNTPAKNLAEYLFLQNEDVYSHPLWSFVQFCKYKKYSKCKKHFNIRRIYPYGNCFTFNISIYGRQIGSGGESLGKANRPFFEVILYKGIGHPPEFDIDVYNNIKTASGIVLIIHEAGTYPHPSNAFIVDGATIVDLKITQVSHAKKKLCLDEDQKYEYVDPVINNTIKFNGSTLDCIYRKKQELFNHKCNCTSHKYPFTQKQFSDYEYCYNLLPTEYYLCKLIIELIKGDDPEHNDSECSSDLCEHTSFSAVITQATFPGVEELNTIAEWVGLLRDLEKSENEHYHGSDLKEMAVLNYNMNNHSLLDIQHLAENTHNFNAAQYIDQNFIEKNFVYLRVVPSSYYMDMIKEEEEYTFNRLLSDIGGCAGLWVGASFITIIELVDLFLNLLQVKWFCCFTRKKPVTTSEHENDELLESVIHSNFNQVKPIEMQQTTQAQHSAITQYCRPSRKTIYNNNMCSYDVPLTSLV